MLVAELDVRVLSGDGEVLRRLTLDPTRDYQARFLARAFDPPLDPSLLLDLHAALVELYLERGSLVLAERAANAALDLAEEGEPEARAEACFRASRVYAERGRWGAAPRGGRRHGGA